MGCIRLPTGVKWCKSEGVKDKLTPHSYIFSVFQEGKMMIEFGVISPLPPNSYIILPPLNKLLPHSYTILSPSAAQHQFTPSILHCFSPHTWRLPVLNPQSLYPQLVLLNLQTINVCPSLDGLYKWIIIVGIATSQQFTPSLLHHFTP